MALVSSSEPEHIAAVTQHQNVAELFEAAVTLRDVTYPKPHPESLELALTKLGGSKDKAVMIGDSGKDLEAAKNAGIESILFFSPEHVLFYDIAALKRFCPTFICNSFSEMRDILFAE